MPARAASRCRRNRCSGSRPRPRSFLTAARSKCRFPTTEPTLRLSCASSLAGACATSPPPPLPATSSGMVGVVQSHGDDLGRNDGRQRADSLELGGFSFERGRPKHVPAEAINLAVHGFRVENLFAFLKSANCCHKVGFM